jgi:hypothetical protein
MLAIVAVIHLTIDAMRYLSGLGLSTPTLDVALNLIPRWIVIGQQPFWFPLGIVFGLYSKEFSLKLSPIRWKLLAGAILCLLLTIAEYYVSDYFNGPRWLGPTNSSFFRNIYILCTILFVISLEDRQLVKPKQVTDLGAKSLGIYMANIPAIYLTALVMYHLTPRLLGYQFIYIAILFVAGLFGPLLLMSIVRRTPMRRFYRYLFG